MKSKFKLMSLAALLLALTSCSKSNSESNSKSNKWEYKTVSFDSEKFQGRDKARGETLSSTTVILQDSTLNRFGRDGWEIATSYLELETVFPVQSWSSTGVKELQSNIRPQKLVIVFKRAID